MGEKRKVEVNYADQSKRSAIGSEMDVDRYIPFSVYLEKELPKGNDQATCRLDFLAIVESMQSECKWSRSQWFQSGMAFRS